MPVKHWGFAGLLLTYWCNARCASCYVCSSPQATGDMSVPDGLAFWEGLQSASPHGCRIHIGGGEPFGRWETLLELARRAQAARLGRLQAVETNAFWAGDEGLIRERLKALDEAGMERLTVSCDPYHQQYVPIANVRLLARVAEETLGTERVRVRWRDWANSGCDTAALPDALRQQLFAEFARRRRDRLSGRAAVELARHLPLAPASRFAGQACGASLLRSRHVHVDPDGNICPGACAGIILGRAGEPISEIWRNLREHFADMEVIGVLVAEGPAGLARIATRQGWQEDAAGYATPCHLCWCVRRWLFEKGYFPRRLGPVIIYRT